MLEEHRDILSRGTVLVDESGSCDQVRKLFFLETSIQDGRTGKSGKRQIISKEFQFIEIDEDGSLRNSILAPYLDYRPLTQAESKVATKLISNNADNWLHLELGAIAKTYAETTLVPTCVDEVKLRRLEEIDRIEQQVSSRLKREINHWDRRAHTLRSNERSGKSIGKQNSAKAKLRANRLSERLDRRLESFELEREISPLPPTIFGNALIIPVQLLKSLMGDSPLNKNSVESPSAESRAEIERLAMDAVLELERNIGNEPRDVSLENRGYDIESRDQKTGGLRFIEVKGRVHGATTITVTRNEICTALNSEKNFRLAVVLVLNGIASVPKYVKQPFRNKPDFGVASINYKIADLIGRAGPP